MRKSKFYLALLILIISSNVFATGMLSTVPCYEAEGKMVLEDQGWFFYVNYMASSQKSLKITNPEVLVGKYKRLKKYHARLQFSVVKDCNFQCDIQLDQIKILPPWKKIDPTDEIKKCQKL